MQSEHKTISPFLERSWNAVTMGREGATMLSLTNWPVTFVWCAVPQPSQVNYWPGTKAN